MAGERWLPLKYQLPDGTILGTLLHGGLDWQILRIDRENRALIARYSLAEHWIGRGLLPDGALELFSFGDDRFRLLRSGALQRLEPVQKSRSADSKADGLAFALSLRQTRKIDRDTSLHDAIYAERYSRLLPTWSLSQNASDEEVFGRWLTGGVSVAAMAPRRLCSLVRGFSETDIGDLIAAAGFAAPNEFKLASGQRSLPDGETTKSQNTLRKQAAGIEFAKSHQFQLSGRPLLERFFNDHVVDIIENADRYKALGIEFPTAIVLHGPPGCGKTFAVDRLGEYLDWPIFHVDSNTVGSPFIHETSRKVGQIFDTAIDAAPSMIVIDEMESYLSDRQLHPSSGLYHVEEVAEFLRRIPEAASRQVLVIGMTNRIEMIDSAILRRGRFDHIIEVGMPSAEEVSELLEALLQKLPLNGKIDIQLPVRALTGRPLSDAAFVIREAARLAAKAGKHMLDESFVLEALHSLPPQVPTKQSIGFIRD